jgi:hypothetical protein
MKKYFFPALLLSVPTLISWYVNYLFPQKSIEYSLQFSITNWIVSLMLVFIIVRRYKLVVCKNEINFKNAFSYTFKVVLCYAIIMGFMSLILEFLFPEHSAEQIQKALQVQQANTIAKNGSVSASQIKTMNLVGTLLNNPFIIALTAMIGGIFNGAIYALIVAAVLKSKTKE